MSSHLSSLIPGGVVESVSSALRNPYFTGGIAVGATALYGVKKFFAGGVNKYSPDLSNGNYIVITGANTGIGKETARFLAHQCKSKKVILACRDPQRGKAAASEIGGGVTFMELDLASLASVRSFVGALAKENKKVDILINNAGVMACPPMKTKDGFELQFGTNHLGHYLLTNLMLSNGLINEHGGRILNLSSMAHRAAPKNLINFDDIMYEHNYDKWVVYGQSKLANILFTADLQNKLQAKNKDIMTFSVHPGAVDTELMRHLSGATVLTTLMKPLVYLLFKSPFEGAQTSLHCALAPKDEMEKFKGLYFADCAQKQTSYPIDLKVAEKLNNVSADLVGLKPEEQWWK